MISVKFEKPYLIVVDRVFDLDSNYLLFNSVIK